ncbi:MAG: lipid II-degrading bacteriocin [Proteobacteria bacterium]|nr:lipid II-degrading bacteriocin [Pseudomonadota bacterium]
MPIQLPESMFARWDIEPAAPPPDPMAAREEKIANDTRVESEINRFMAARQDALFHAPDAFYRTEGEDAIHAAPVARQKLDDLRQDLIDRAANDYQRGRLTSALDAQMELTRDGLARHVAEQSLAWQRQVAQDRIALLAKEAALHHGDDSLIDVLGHAAASAARAHARVGDGPIGGEAEDSAAATARSGVLGAAIQARLDRGDTDGAKMLLTKVGDQLDPAHAAPLWKWLMPPTLSGGAPDVQLAKDDPRPPPQGRGLVVEPSGGLDSPTSGLGGVAPGTELAPGSDIHENAKTEAESIDPDLREVDTATDAYGHWLGSSGQALRYPFNRIDTKSVRPEQFDAVKEVLKRGKPGIYPIQGIMAFATDGKSKHELPDVIGKIGDINRNPRWIVGNITLSLKGELIINDDKSYSFKGKLGAAPDLYDMNAATHRAPLAELLTTMGRKGGESLGHTNYRIHFPGEKEILSRGDVPQ